MNHDSYGDDYIRSILDDVRTIAVVGASPDWNRPSSFVMKYMATKGFRLFGVNPKAASAGQRIGDGPAFASLAEVPEPIDMVDIFRNSEAAGAVVDEALDLAPLPKAIWMQFHVRNDAAAARAEARGIRVVMNRCPKVEYSRLNGELGWTGVNPRVLTSRRRKLSP
ncbi:MAG: CoA-binding protein [Rhodospirillaceae bacterium]|nr:CoA-binding protein [Rhodospirillaceae bacterium]